MAEVCPRTMVEYECACVIHVVAGVMKSERLESRATDSKLYTIIVLSSSCLAHALAKCTIIIDILFVCACMCMQILHSAYVRTCMQLLLLYIYIYDAHACIHTPLCW